MILNGTRTCLGAVLAALLLLSVYAGPAFAQRTAAAPSTETTYQSRPRPTPASLDRSTTPTMREKTPTPEPPISTETEYNRFGTNSESNIGLLSNRRKNPEFVGFLQGMQAASIAANRTALNVAPMDAETLEDQIRVLSQRGVEYFLVDSPDPAEARTFIENTTKIGLKTLLIGEKPARGFSPPLMVVNMPLYSEVIAETAIHRVGNTSASVGYIVGKVDDAQREIVLDYFNRPFNQVAKEVRLTEIDPEKYEGGFEKFDVVCVLTREASAEIAPRAKRLFPDSLVILCGESPNVVYGIEAGYAGARVRPNYAQIFSSAVREFAMKSDFPPMPRPVVDRAK